MAITIDDSLLISGSVENLAWSNKPVSVLDASVLPKKGNSGDYVVEVKNQEGELLYTNNFELIPVQVPPEFDIDLYNYSVMVPAYPETSKIYLKNLKEDVFIELAFEGNKPNVSFVNQPSGNVASHFLTSWSGSDSDSEDIYYSLDYSNNNGLDGSWVWSTGWLSNTEYMVDFSYLPGSSVTSSSFFRVIASDGVNFNEVLSSPFQVPLKSPQVEFFKESLDKNFIQFKQTINWSIQLHGPDADNIPETNIVWESNVDGFLQEGKVLSYNNLSPGLHTINVSVTDIDGSTFIGHETDITVVTSPPKISIQLGDGSNPDLDCNELKISVIAGEAPLNKFLWSIDGVNKKIEVPIEQLPLIYQLTEPINLLVVVTDDAKFTDRKVSDVDLVDDCN